MGRLGRNLSLAVPAGHLGTPILLLNHPPGALSLRLGLGPGLRPTRALNQLQGLFTDNGPWASGRSIRGLRRMLQGSEAVVSAWRGVRLVAFGRATSDGQYRGVLWDVVVAKDMQGQGLGRRVVETLLKTPPLLTVERIYLMTGNSRGFYERLGFHAVSDQTLMRLR